jgi:FKBP-type peptidyl-prolyl cis-trans isomerase
MVVIIFFIPAGVLEALPLMSIGDTFDVFCPYYTAYGKYGSFDKKVPPVSSVIYTILLFTVRLLYSAFRVSRVRSG